MKLLSEIISWAETIVGAAFLALLITIFVFQPTQVLGSSMQPTLENGNYVFVSKLMHTFNSEPSYGDIVIIDSRLDQKHTLKDDLTANPLVKLISRRFTGDAGHDYFIKRVIGKPGDTIEFKEGVVYRNGEALDEPYIKEPMAFESDQKYVIPEGHVFVMGDNRNNSLDSRFIGSVPFDHVMGKMIVKIF
jgi:signal peptidase I